MFIALNVTCCALLARYIVVSVSFFGVDGFAREPLAVYCFCRDALDLCLY